MNRKIDTFDLYPETLPVWEKELFKKLKMYSDCDMIVNRFNEDEYDRLFCLTLVSDGAGKDGTMIFGWSARAGKENTFAECVGPAYRYCKSLFRAEAYGMLSRVQWIYHLGKYTNKEIDWTIQYYANNKGLITRVNAQLTYADDYPSNNNNKLLTTYTSGPVMGHGSMVIL